MDKNNSFYGLGIAPKILEALDRMKFTVPTPIQHKAIPVGIEGKDIIGVAQTGKRFMQDIPRCPKPVEVEAARADVSLSHGFPAFPAPLQCTEIAVAVFVLDFLEFLYDIVRSLFETRISRGGPHQAYSREVMSGDVTGEISSAAVPAAVWFALRL